MSEETFVYCIDDADVIVSVSGNWSDFAADNGWGRDFGPDDVVGKSLWSFIHDFETRHLYEEVFGRVRRGAPCGPIPFRCDSPEARRYLELLVSLRPDGNLELVSIIRRVERRDPVLLLDAGVERSEELLRICSMCKKIAAGEGRWVEVEDGLARLRPFEADRMPRLTHGVCPDCFRIATSALDL
jgi:hypothetical protein